MKTFKQILSQLTILSLLMQSLTAFAQGQRQFQDPTILPGLDKSKIQEPNFAPSSGNYNLPGASESSNVFMNNLLNKSPTAIRTNAAPPPVPAPAPAPVDPSASVPNTLPSAPALGPLPTARESREGPGTMYAKFCTDLGKTPAPTQDEPMPCCWGLILKDGKCEDPSMVDPLLSRCSSDNDCSDGKGCFKFSMSKDMFSADNYLNQTKREGLKAILAKEIADHSPLKLLQGKCYRNAECESRNCMLYNSFNVDSKQCVGALGVCRKAEALETANGNVQCGEGLTKDSSSKCVPEPITTADMARGLIDDLNIKEVGVGLCQFEFESGVADQAKLNIKSLRALEILFSSAEVDTNRFDATRMISGFMRPEIGEKIQAARIAATNVFNTQMKLIDLSQSSLEGAKIGDKTKVSFDGSMVTRDDLANGSIDGYYPNILRKKRNEVFQAYEISMKAMLDDTKGAISGISNLVQTIPSNSKDWTIGAVHWNVIHPNKGRPELWDSLTHRYQIDGSKQKNRSVFERRSFITSQLFRIREAHPYDIYGNNTYWMVDPVMPEGINPHGYSFMWFGNHDGALFNDQKWWRKFNEFTGGNGNNGDVSHFEEVRKQFKTYVINYFKNKRDPNIQNYIFEPELLAIKLAQSNNSATSNQNCLERMTENSSFPVNDPCLDTQDFIDQISDIMFVQWWSWSAHDKEGFFKFWGYNNTWRAYLLRHYEVVYDNLIRYYWSLAAIRLLQNECLDKLIAQHHNNTKDDGPSGVTPDAEDYTAPRTGSGNGGGPKPPKRTPIEFVKDPRGNLSFDPSKLNFNDFRNNSFLDKFGLTSKNGSGSGSIGKGSSSDQAAFNARIKKMKDDVSKLSKSDAEKRDKVSAKIASIAASAAGSRGGGQSSGSSNSSAIPGFGNMPKATLSEDPSKNKKEGDDKDIISKDAIGVGGAGKTSAGSAGGMNYGAYDSNSSGSGSGSGQGNGKDATGMSDEEKNATLANLERTKSNYNPNDNDTLFGVVSKAYMRNLDKFLKKKKSIQE